ncbi:MAG: hypothetical protein ABI777_09945 [Betaproteobacteria bacterium]
MADRKVIGISETGSSTTADFPGPFPGAHAFHPGLQDFSTGLTRNKDRIALT